MSLTSHRFWTGSALDTFKVSPVVICTAVAADATVSMVGDCGCHLWAPCSPSHYSKPWKDTGSHWPLFPAFSWAPVVDTEASPFRNEGRVLQGLEVSAGTEPSQAILLPEILQLKGAALPKFMPPFWGGPHPPSHTVAEDLAFLPLHNMAVEGYPGSRALCGAG